MRGWLKRGKNRDGKGKIIITLKRKTPLIGIMLIAAVIAGMLTARYVSHNEMENEMIAAGFHFSSIELKEEGSDILRIKPGIFDVDIRNYEVENYSRVSEMDIDYTISVKYGVDSDSLINTLPSSQITVSSDETDPPTEIRPDAEGNHVLHDGGDSRTNRIVHTVHINGNVDGSGTKYIPVGGNTTVNVKASATYPYIKILEANYTVKGIEVKIEDAGGGIYRLLIRTNQYEGPLTLTWNSNTFPAAGVNEQDYGWEVQYNALGNPARRFAKQEAEKNSTYIFEYNESAGTPIPVVSGTWEEAEISAGL